MQAFEYNGNIYVKIIPCKSLFNSTTIHEVVTRGSIFALNLNTSIFTVLPQGADQGKFNEQSKNTRQGQDGCSKKSGKGTSKSNQSRLFE
jgi:hypothetical protein